MNQEQNLIIQQFGQTTFSGNDNDSQSLTYTAGRIDVYLNDPRLNVTDDYVNEWNISRITIR